MLKAFIDDSGSGGDSQWFVLAGYVGTAEAWDAFDEPWRKVLDGPPQIEVFKASQAESLKGRWAGITKDERDSRINALIEVIGRHAIRAIYVRVKQQDFDEVIKPWIPTEWQNAYYFLYVAFLSAGTSSEKYAGTSRRIDFVFDSNTEVEKPSKKLYSQVNGIPQFHERVGSIEYKDDKASLPLQAADLFAWQVRRRFSVQESPRPQFEAALNCPSEMPFTHTLTRERLNTMGQDMDQHWMMEWAIRGHPEHLRKWRRPKGLI
jgi:hypothetical protein